MKLSLVLWNCDGTEGTEDQPKANVEKRKAVFRSTYDSWKQAENEIPTVVLAQELHLVGLTRTWRELSKKSNSFNTCEAACFFLMGLGQEIEFLDSGDLQRIMGRKVLSKNQYVGGIARIHCGIVALGAEKILICSWHGEHYKLSDDKNKVKLEKMLIFVDKVREDQGCVAALVGGDFNLNKKKAEESTLLSAMSAYLYAEYVQPTFRTRIIDYVIVWPKHRFIKCECVEIKTHPEEEVNPNPRMFDHALIRYDFIVKMKGEWEGEGLVKWVGKCGEGEVTLTGDHRRKYFDVKVTRVRSKKWKGPCFCKRFEKLKNKCRRSLRVNYGERCIYVAEGETVTLTTKRCQREGAGANVSCIYLSKCEQTVTWNGTGSVEWNGKGKATWVGGKLEKWKGSQTVRCADDRKVQWNGDGEVELKGGKFKTSHQGTWTCCFEGVRYSLTEGSELGWSGRGVVWNVTGKGEGTMLDWDTV